METFKNRFAPFVKDGEKFVCITSQSGTTIELTKVEKKTGLIVNNETDWGFSYNNKLYKTTTAICKAVLNRDGQTNEWRGPQHVYILRDGLWKRFNSL